MSQTFLAVSLVGALFVINGYRPFARRGPLSVPSFFAGWLTTELPLHHIAWQAVATAVFIALGALHHAAGWAALGITLVSWAALANLSFQAQRASGVLEDALQQGLGRDYRRRILPQLEERIDPRVPPMQIVMPFAPHHSDVRRTRNIPYGPHGRRNMLDVYRHVDEPRRSPVLVQVHGGAWIMGDKWQQALPLMNHLASLGWVCVALNYRLSPRATFPDHIVDVKRAIAWVKEHIADYGGDPGFLVLTGGSAGGHLSALAALTPNDPEYQPGFEERDTTLQACVPFYGIFDFIDRDELGRSDMRGFLERLVFKRKMDDDRTAFDRASPIARVSAEAPPFLIVHGANDSLAPVEEARAFAERLRAVSRCPVVYAELPGAQHAFEVFGSFRTAHAVRAVERFAAVVYSDYRSAAGDRPEPPETTQRAAPAPESGPEASRA